ncbi:MAG: hypothetical protein V1779_15165 [bacterium]
MDDIFNIKIFPIIIQMEKSKLENFEIFYLELLSHMHGKAKELSEKVNERAKGIRQEIMSDEDYDQLDFLGEDYETYTKDYSNHINQTILVSVYSFLENQTKSLLNTVIKYSNPTKSNLKIDVNKIRHDLFGNYKKGIEKVSGISLTKYDKDYQQLKNFQFIRNKIVHNNSHIDNPKDDKRISEMKTIYFDINSRDIFLYDENFVITFIEVVVRYLNSILIELEAQKNNFNNKKAQGFLSRMWMSIIGLYKRY